MNNGLSKLKNILAVYLVCFLGWVAWVFATENFLFQLQPVVVQNRLDLTLNLLLSTGIHTWIIEHPSYCFILDLLFIFHPLLLFASIRTPSKSWLAWGAVLLNIVYSLLLSSYTLYSIQGWIGWFLIPLIFTTSNDKARELYIEGLRYAFILIFLSSGLWKIRAGGLFEIETMSGILITQHANEFAFAPEGSYMSAIRWLVNHPYASYSIYAIATLLELIFVVGLFTKRWDKWLSWAIIAFVSFDILLMQINYSSWMAFIPVILAASKQKD